MRKFFWVLPIITVLLLLMGTVALAQGSQGGFPDAHKEFLGGASYAALFGQVEDAGSSSASPPAAFNPRRPPNVSPNVVVNAPQVIPPAGRIGRSETTVAVGGEGKFVVAGWNDADGFLHAPFGGVPGTPGLSGYGVSTDGGQTFADGGTPFIPGAVDPANPACGGLVTRGDPWLDIGGPGNDTFYYANLAVHEDFTCANITFGGIPAGVSVHRGQFSDGGFSWDDVQLLQSPGFPNDFYDKEALATDKNGSRSHVYVSLTNFEGIPISADCSVAGGFGTIEVWRSLDGGDTWQGPTVVQPDQTVLSDLTCLTGRLNQGSQPAVGPRGEVYVAYQNGPDFVGGVTPAPLDVDIMVARSDNFGASFTAPVKVADINSIRNRPPDGYNRTRINDFPRIAVANSGPFRGRVYVAFQSAPSPGVKRSDVFVSFSDDRGQTWSTPVLIGAPAPVDTVRFWPVVSVQTGGNVDVVYYESVETNLTPSSTDRECRPPGRAVPGQTRSSLVDVFWAQSIDGGASFETPVRVTDVTSNWCKARVNIIPNFGDYIDARSFGNKVFVSWADGRLPITPDTLPPPGGPRDRTADAFYATINTLGRAPR